MKHTKTKKSEIDLIQDRIRYLREKTDFSSTLFESLIGYSIIAADFDGNIIAYNEGARQIYGYAPEEIVGKENIEIFFPEDFIEKGRLQNIINNLLDKGRFSYEGEKVRKDGSRFPAQILFTLTKDKNSNVVGFVEIVENLTEKKRYEAELSRHNIDLQKSNAEMATSRAFLAAVLDSAIDAILTVDEQEIIKSVNKATINLFGYDESELIGTNLSDLLPEPYRSELQGNISHFVQRKEKEST